MEKENIIRVKSFDYGVRIFKLYKWLLEHHRIYSVADQILRSGTAIGANIEEATGGFTKKEFAVKIGIAYKEARETRYWLRILHAGGCLDDKVFDSMLADCEELIRILGSISDDNTTKYYERAKASEGVIVLNSSLLILNLK